jgi:hypothetical protein
MTEPRTEKVPNPEAPKKFSEVTTLEVKAKAQVRGRTREIILKIQVYRGAGRPMEDHPGGFQDKYQQLE